jgi:AraC-like DNA-binding protein
LVFLERCSPKDLSRAVSAVHYHRPQAPDGMYRRLPLPWATLIITLGARSAWRSPSSEWRPFPEIALRGPATAWSLGQDEENRQVEYLVALIEPWAVGPLFDVDPRVTRGNVVDLRQLCGARAERLLDQVHSAACPQQKMSAVVRDLRGRVKHFEADDLSARFVETCRSRAGALSVAAAASRSGCSERWFRRRVGDAIGVTPKRWAMVERFAAKLRQLHANPWHSWTAGAAPEYFDQSHEIREFHEMAGMTPRQYRSTKQSGDRRVFLTPAISRM